MQSLKVFIGKFHYEKKDRMHLVDLLKPIVPELSLSKYGIKYLPLEIVKDLNAADCIILPYTWNYYINKEKKSIAYEMVDIAKKNNIKIFICVTGDFFYSLPNMDHIIGLFTSPYKSLMKNNSISLPIIITDKYSQLSLNKFQINNYSSIPTIGFCGHVEKKILFSIIKLIKLIIQNLLFYFNISNKYSGPIIPATVLRKKILDTIERSNIVRSNFIRRSKYAGGVSKNHKSIEYIRKEFNQNILESDYTLCIRGTGNFSARFYETLSLGRIPVFINTNCQLPYENLIEWKKHVVWIEFNEITKIDQKVNLFHSKLNNKTFVQLQKQNRRLWEEYFSFSSSMNRLIDQIKKII